MYPIQYSIYLRWTIGLREKAIGASTKHVLHGYFDRFRVVEALGCRGTCFCLGLRG